VRGSDQLTSGFGRAFKRNSSSTASQKSKHDVV